MEFTEDTIGGSKEDVAIMDTRPHVGPFFYHFMQYLWQMTKIIS